MKSIVLVLLTLVLTQISAQAQPKTVNDLASDIENITSTPENMMALEREDKRFIKNQLRDVIDVFAEYGIEPSNKNSRSSLYICAGERDVELYRQVLNQSGKTMRSDLIQTYKSGLISERRALCKENISKTKISSKNYTSCSCTNDREPILKIKLINKNTLKDIKTIGLFKYTSGLISERTSNCMADVKKYAFCNKNNF